MSTNKQHHLSEREREKERERERKRERERERERKREREKEREREKLKIIECQTNPQKQWFMGYHKYHKPRFMGCQKYPNKPRFMGVAKRTPINRGLLGARIDTHPHKERFMVYGGPIPKPRLPG